MQNILEVRDLGRSYVNFRLEHISFSIAGGTIMGLVGCCCWSTWSFRWLGFR